MSSVTRARKTKGKKWIYLLIEIASILAFTMPILNFMNEMSVDWAEANKNTITNGELLYYASMMLVGSVLIAALIGVPICIIVRLIIGKDALKTDAIETVVTKEPKMKKKRELPSKTEVLYIAIAVLGVVLALCSFLYCTGIEYVSFEQDILSDEAFLGDLEGSIEDTVIDTFLSEGALSGKWGVLMKLMVASERGESISFGSFFAPDKILILGLLAIIISVAQIKFGCGKDKLNIATIVIAVIAILLNKFLSPWIQLLGGVFYHTFINGFVDWAVGLYTLLKQTAEAFIDLFSPFLSEEFRNQKYIDGLMRVVKYK